MEVDQADFGMTTMADPDGDDDLKTVLLRGMLAVGLGSVTCICSFALAADTVMTTVEGTDGRILQGILSGKSLRFTTQIDTLPVNVDKIQCFDGSALNLSGIGPIDGRFSGGEFILATANGSVDLPAAEAAEIRRFPRPTQDTQVPIKMISPVGDGAVDVSGNWYASFNGTFVDRDRRGNHSYHAGIDLGGAFEQTPVVAAADGEVVLVIGLGPVEGCETGNERHRLWDDIDQDGSVDAGELLDLECSGRKRDNHGYGMSVVIRHDNGLYSQYSHLSAITKQAWDGALDCRAYRVKQGEAIGVLGASDKTALNSPSMPPHLHFEVKYVLNPDLSDRFGLYWGYTPDLPDPYGYRDPLIYLRDRPAGVQESLGEGIALRIEGSESCQGDWCGDDGRGIRIYAGPGTEYAVLGWSGRGQRLVADAKLTRTHNCPDETTISREWYRIHLPNRPGPVATSGWIPSLSCADKATPLVVRDDEARIIEIINADPQTGEPLRTTPGADCETQPVENCVRIWDRNTKTYRPLRIWNGSKLVTSGTPRIEAGETWHQIDLPLIYHADPAKACEGKPHASDARDQCVGHVRTAWVQARASGNSDVDEVPKDPGIWQNGSQTDEKHSAILGSWYCLGTDIYHRFDFHPDNTFTWFHYNLLADDGTQRIWSALLTEPLDYFFPSKHGVEYDSAALSALPGSRFLIKSLSSRRLEFTWMRGLLLEMSCSRERPEGDTEKSRAEALKILNEQNGYYLGKWVSSDQEQAVEFLPDGTCIESRFLDGSWQSERYNFRIHHYGESASCSGVGLYGREGPDQILRSTSSYGGIPFARQIENGSSHLHPIDRIELKDGSVLAGILLPVNVSFASTFGALDVDLSEIQAFSNGSIRLSDGSVLKGEFRAGTVAISTNRGKLEFGAQEVVVIEREIDGQPSGSQSAQPAAGQGLLTGRVIDNFGGSVSDATVKIIGTALASQTSPDGSYTLKFVPGELAVRIERVGFNPVQFSLSIAQPSTYPLEDKELLRLPPEPGLFYWAEAGWSSLGTCKLDQTGVIPNDGNIDFAGTYKDSYRVSGVPLVVDRGDNFIVFDYASPSGVPQFFRVDENDEIVTRTQSGGLTGAWGMFSGHATRTGTSDVAFGQKSLYPGQLFYTGNFEPGHYVIIHSGVGSGCYHFQVVGSSRNGQRTKVPKHGVRTIAVDDKKVNLWLSEGATSLAYFQLDSKGFRNIHLLDCANGRFRWTENIDLSTAEVSHFRMTIS